MERAGDCTMRFSRTMLGLPLTGLLVLAGCVQQNAAKPGLTGEAYLRVADAVSEAGDTEKAVSLYKDAASKFPADIGVQISSANGMARNGDRKEAISLLRSRLRTAPDNPDLLRAMGGIQIIQGDARAAVATLDHMLGKHPDDVPALVNRGVALDLLHQHDEAQAAYRKAHAIAPDDVTISNDLALSLMLSGHSAEARAEMAHLRDASDLPERVGINLAIIDAVSGHPEDSREILSTRIGDADLAQLTQAIEGGPEGAVQPAPRTIQPNPPAKISRDVPAAPSVVVGAAAPPALTMSGRPDMAPAPVAARFANVPPPPPLDGNATPVAAYASSRPPVVIPAETVGDASALEGAPR